MARLEEICTINMGQSPDSSSYNEQEEGLPFFQGNADFGEVSPTVRIWCNSPTKIAEEGDILISVRAPIGALNIADCQCCIGRGLAALTADERKCSRRYLWHALSSKVEELNSKGTGSTFKAISKKVLVETEVSLPTISEQTAIVQKLDAVDNLIAWRTQQLSKLDQLVKSRFIEMFGEPVANTYSWPVKSLLTMGTCKNGMNFHYDDNGSKIHCLGVGDFQEHTYIRDITVLPQISLRENPTEEYLLQDEDIVFVRSNGNKSLVGRCVAVYPANIPTTFSGFCIRYRNHEKLLSIPYLLHVLKTDSIRSKLAGRGANIQNLNQQMLGALLIPLPPLPLQEEFASFVQQVDKSKSVVKRSSEKLETLKKSLMQEYFG